MKLTDESDRFALDLYSLINAPRYEGGPRTVLSVLACSLSLEHWDAVRCLIRSRLLSSAVIVHRAQSYGLAQSLWRLHAATNLQITKLLADLTGEGDSTASCLAFPRLRSCCSKFPPKRRDRRATRSSVSTATLGRRSIRTLASASIRCADTSPDIRRIFLSWCCVTQIL